MVELVGGPDCELGSPSLLDVMKVVISAVEIPPEGIHTAPKEVHFEFGSCSILIIGFPRPRCLLWRLLLTGGVLHDGPTPTKRRRESSYFASSKREADFLLPQWLRMLFRRDSRQPLDENSLQVVFIIHLAKCEELFPQRLREVSRCLTFLLLPRIEFCLRFGHDFV